MIKKNKYLTDKEEEDYLKSQQFVEDTKRIIMENREYYTPEISELFLGYKCQRRVTKPNYVEKYLYEWRDYTVDEHYFSVGYEEGQDWNYYEVELRTPYLCKQDIIDLNWEFIEDLENNIHFKKESYLLNFHKTNGDFKNAVEILFAAPTGMCIFRGIVKSKNELKKLMKDYLNISI